MSTAADNPPFSQQRRSIFIAAFLALLLLALEWPRPILWINSQTLQRSLSIDERSFLGREAPSWDMVFLCIAGLYALALFQTAGSTLASSWSSWRNDVSTLPATLAARGSRLRETRWIAAFAGGAALVALCWLFLDDPLIAWSESIQSESSRAVARLFNRIGGGMNPTMIVLFFLLGGIALGQREWWRLGFAMVFAALSAGALAQIVKAIAGRSRPELWLGAFAFSRESASSFPSGHTVGAFAIAGVIFFGASSRVARYGALLVAIGVGCSRVLSFRHWPSDVLASAVIGLFFSRWFVGSVIGGQKPGDIAES